jgi:UDP-N-acetylmuramoylalanine--D-glutamate ligase
VWLSGNIGNEPLLTRLDQIAPDDLVVLELSSFQLEQLAQIQKAPTVALLTNLTPNHLDRYGTFENYCAAKESIFKFQKLDDKFPAVSIFNVEDKVSAEWFAKYKKDAGRICITFSADDISEQIRESFPLPGRVNLSNLAAAVAIARHFGIDDDQLRNSLPQFKALPHRLELVAEVDGISWYNDSKATTPESAIAAIEAFEEPTIIIAGGYDKHVAFGEFGKIIAEKTKLAVLIGQTAEKIAEAIRKTQDSSFKAQETIQNTRIEVVDSLAEAVQLANKVAESGDVVLLSPACASYDMFENFEHRGQEFCKLVREINK